MYNVLYRAAAIDSQPAARMYISHTLMLSNDVVFSNRFCFVISCRPSCIDAIIIEYSNAVMSHFPLGQPL